MTRTPSLESFDPAHVPPYPVLTLTGADDPDNVTLEGQKFEGDDAYDDALAECVKHAAALNGAVRVRGVDKDGNEWPLVITSQGEIHDLSASASGTKKSSRGATSSSTMDRRTLMAGAIVGLGGLILTGGGIAAGVAIYQANQPDPPPPPPKFPGKGALVPVAVPQGVAANAQWAVKIDSAFTPQLVNDQWVVALTTDNALVLLDVATGQVQWSASNVMSLQNEGTLMALRINTVPMLAHAHSRGLTVWRLDKTAVSESQSVKIAHGSADVFAGGSMPLWALDSQVAQFLRGDKLASVDVPVPARAVGLHKDAVVAIQQGQWLAVTGTGQATPHPLYKLPKGELVSGYVLGNRLFSAWQNGKKHTLTMHELDSSRLLASATLDGRLRDSMSAPLLSPTKTTAVWADCLFTPASIVPLATLTPDGATNTNTNASHFKAASVSDTDVWGTFGRQAARYRIAENTLTLDGEDTELPLFISPKTRLAFIVADKLGDTVLHALPFDSTSASDSGGAQ